MQRHEVLAVKAEQHARCPFRRQVRPDFPKAIATAATVLAGELARRAEPAGIQVTLIDADPNQHSAKWALRDCPRNLALIQRSNETSIVDDIEQAEEKSGYVLVDLEGTASATVANAIIRADYVIALCQGSQDDADEAVKTIKLINSQSKLLKRVIPFAVLFTRTNPAIQPRTLRHIIQQFEEAGIDLFQTSLIDREAFRAIRSFGGMFARSGYFPSVRRGKRNSQCRSIRQ